jgi:nitrogen regulatory protein P-II 1
MARGGRHRRRRLTQHWVSGGAVRLVRSIVRLEKLNCVKQALTDMHVHGLMVSEVRDHSPQRHETTVWMGQEYNLGSSMKVEIDVVVHDDDVDNVVSEIIRTARTGQAGDGFVSVMPVEHRYNIRNGEREVS